MTDEFWGKSDREMTKAAIKLLTNIAKSVESIDNKLNPVIVTEEQIVEEVPRFLGTGK